jgi:hypothetical protein
LGIGKTNAKADEAEANDERCMSFHGLIEGEKVELGDGETLRPAIGCTYQPSFSASYQAQPQNKQA